MPYPDFVCDCLYRSDLLESLGLKVICVTLSFSNREFNGSIWIILLSEHVKLVT